MFQDSIVGSIIGSVISTAGAILVWVIIEIIKFYKKKSKIKTLFKNLFNLFMSEKSEPLLSIKIANLINILSMPKFIGVLKFAQLYAEGKTMGYHFANPLFMIDIIFKAGHNDVRIIMGDKTFDYKKQDTNTYIKDAFLEFFEEQCKIENIKLKKE